MKDIDKRCRKKDVKQAGCGVARGTQKKGWWEKKIRKSFMITSKNKEESGVILHQCVRGDIPYTYIMV